MKHTLCGRRLDKGIIKSCWHPIGFYSKVYRMRKNRKYILMVLLIFVAPFIAYLYINKIRIEQENKETMNLANRLSLIERKVSELALSVTANEVEFVNNARFAKYYFTNKSIDRAATEYVNLYYEIIETYNASAQIGVFEYNGVNNNYRIYVGIDYPSEKIVILEGNEIIYRPPNFTHKGQLTNFKLLHYLLSQQWRNILWESQGRRSTISLWDPSKGKQFSANGISQKAYHIIQ